MQLKMQKKVLYIFKIELKLRYLEYETLKISLFQIQAHYFNTPINIHKNSQFLK